MTDTIPTNVEAIGPSDPIRQWFVEHDGDDEFSIPPWDAPYQVIPPPPGAGRLLYATKPWTVLRLFAGRSSELPVGLIGRVGLPHDGDVPWLRSGASGCRILFVGDADPCDLLIFAWLRRRLEISFRGLNDSLLRSCGVSITDSITIRQSESEQAAMPLVTGFLPDFPNLVGDGCAAILKRGRKLEFESLVSNAAVTPLEVVDALMD